MIIGRSDSRTSHANDVSLDLGEFSREIWTEAARGLDAPQRLKLTCGLRDLKVVVDQSYLHALLSNLFQNAIKFSPGRDEVLVDISEQRGSLTVRVTDYGVGVLPDEATTIFEPFRRGSNAASVS